MRKNNLKNYNGVVLLTVLAMIIVMSLLAISILNMNINQVKSSEDQIKQIKAELLGKGLMSYIYASQQSATPSTYISEEISIDGISYSASALLDNSGAGINGTDVVTINVNY